MTRPSQTWKQVETEIARLFSDKSVRNSLSGRNNKNDKGEERPGDCIVPELNALGINCLLEAKYYRTNAVVSRADETRKEAEELGMDHWFHVERRNGNKKVYLLACSPEWMKKVCQFLKEEMIREKYGEKDENPGA